MKKLALILALSTLGGCVVAPPGPPNYGTRGYAYNGDPNQWHVVSVTPVAPGTAERAGQTAATVEYSPAPAQPVYAPQPVYVPPPVYAAPPVYTYDPYYWWPPISIGLGFSWSHGWGGHRGGWGGHRGGGWGGHAGGHFRGR